MSNGTRTFVRSEQDIFNDRIASYERVTTSLEQAMAPMKALQKAMAPLQALEELNRFTKPFQHLDKLLPLEQVNSAFAAYNSTKALTHRIQKLTDTTMLGHSAYAGIDEFDRYKFFLRKHQYAARTWKTIFVGLIKCFPILEKHSR